MKKSGNSLSWYAKAQCSVYLFGRYRHKAGRAVSSGRNERNIHSHGCCSVWTTNSYRCYYDCWHYHCCNCDNRQQGKAATVTLVPQKCMQICDAIKCLKCLKTPQRAAELTNPLRSALTLRTLDNSA